MIAGDIYTIAGDGTQGTGDQAPAAQASFGNLGPDAVAVTGSGAIVVAGGTRIREISGGRTRSLGRPRPHGSAKSGARGLASFG